MNVVPEPDGNDVSVHETASVDLEPGQKVEVVMQPDSQGSLHRIPIVAVTKHSDATYQIDIDGNTERFGPSPVPPTDIDDLAVTFLPALRLQNELRIIVRDVRSTGNPRQYVMQVIGWEA